MDGENLAAEKQTLRGFALTVVEFLGTSDVLRETLRSATGPLAGFREMASDMVEMAQDVHGEALETLDGQLASQGLPTLSAMRNRQYRKLLRVLSAGKISSEAQHRLVLAVLGNLDNGSLADHERTQLEAVLAAHEARQTTV